MRKRYIKSVAHWVIMTIVLLFPILMVGISSFGNSEQVLVYEEVPIYYQSNEVNSSSDLVDGNIYQLTNTSTAGGTILCYQVFGYGSWTNTTVSQSYPTPFIVQSGSTGYLYVKDEQGNGYTSNALNETIYFIYKESASNLLTYMINANEISQTDYKVVKEYVLEQVVQNYYMREDVNQWCNTFRNLPVNQWYGEMLDTIGLGIANSMMMNVIYTYPLYVLWVYIIDLLVDCLLVIINFGHNALKRLGADNE